MSTRASLVLAWAATFFFGAIAACGGGAGAGGAGGQAGSAGTTTVSGTGGAGGTATGSACGPGGVCPEYMVCCAWPAACAGLCVSDCRITGACASAGEKCDPLTGLCGMNDGGTPPPDDGGPPPKDGGPPPKDGGPPPGDGGPPPNDGGQPLCQPDGTCEKATDVCCMSGGCAGHCVGDCRIDGGKACPADKPTCNQTTGLCEP